MKITTSILTERITYPNMNTFIVLMEILKETRSAINGIMISQVAHAITCTYKKEEVGTLIRALQAEYDTQD